LFTHVDRKYLPFEVLTKDGGWRIVMLNSYIPAGDLDREKLLEKYRIREPTEKEIERILNIV
jgi:hypothetical protein